MFTDEVMFELMLCPPSPSDSQKMKATVDIMNRTVTLNRATDLYV